MKEMDQKTERRLWDLDKHENEKHRLRLALLKENSKYRSFWELYGGEKFLNSYFSIDIDLSPEEKVKTPAFIEAENFISGLTRFSVDWPFMADDEKTVKFINLIDPFSTEDIPEPLSHPIFSEYPSVAGVWSAALDEAPNEARLLLSDKMELRPSERLLRIDLSRSRGELIDDFKRLLDRIEYFRKADDVPEAWKLNYATWEPDSSRFRSEAWQAVEVYRLRRKRKTYGEIVKTLDIKDRHGEDALSTAKMAFRRAYELIEGKPYRPEAFKRESLPVSTLELGKTCATCPIRRTCKELCPDMLVFADQDYGSQREATSGAIDLFNLGQQRSRKEKAE
jgi:hypothetical protein